MRSIYLTFIIFFMFSSRAISCECVVFNPKYFFESYEIVAIGTLLKGELTEVNGNIIQSTFKIFNIYKGQMPSNGLINITSDLSPQSCGISLALGYNYVLFIDKKNKISGCSSFEIGPTKNSEKYKQFLEYVEKLKS